MFSPLYSGNDFFKIKVQEVLSPFESFKNVQNQILVHLGFLILKIVLLEAKLQELSFLLI